MRPTTSAPHRSGSRIAASSATGTSSSRRTPASGGPRSASAAELPVVNIGLEEDVGSQSLSPEERIDRLSVRCLHSDRDANRPGILEPGQGTIKNQPLA